MKNILFNLTILLLICGVTFGQDFTEVEKQTNFFNGEKIVVLDFYTDWCKPCKKMDKEVFSNLELKDALSADFQCFKVNGDKKEFEHLKEKYNVYSYPTYVFLTPEGDVMASTLGFKSKNEFMTILQDMKSARSKYQKKSESILKNHDKYFENTKAYLLESLEYGELDKSVFSLFLNRLNPESYFDSTTVFLLSKYTSNCQETSFELLNQARLKKIIPTSLSREVSEVYSEGLNSCLKEAILNKDSVLLAQVLHYKSIDSFDLSPKSSIFNSKMKYLKGIKDTSNYVIEFEKEMNRRVLITEDQILAYCDSTFKILSMSGDFPFSKDKWNEMMIQSEKDNLVNNFYNYAEYVYSYSIDKDLIEVAIQWELRAYDLEPRAEHLYLAALLCCKIKNNEEFSRICTLLKDNFPTEFSKYSNKLNCFD